MEPLSGLATPPSYFRTWPFRVALSAAHRIIPFLPESLQSQLPPTLLPLVLPETGDEVNGAGATSDEVSPPLNRRSRSKQQAALRQKSRSKSGTASNTPRDSPATTELESDDVDDFGGEGEIDGDAEVEVGVDGEKKIKKKGLGKAGGMRRRKMGMKK